MGFKVGNDDEFDGIDDWEKLPSWAGMRGLNFKLMYYNKEEKYLVLVFRDNAIVVHYPVTMENYIHLLINSFPEEYYYTKVKDKTSYKYIIPHCSNHDRMRKLNRDIKGVTSAEDFIDVIAKGKYIYAEIKWAWRKIYKEGIDSRSMTSYILYDMDKLKCVKWTTVEGNVKEGFDLLPEDSPFIKELKSKNVCDVIAGRYILIQGI